MIVKRELKHISDGERIAKIAEKGEQIVSIQDLSVLWGMHNRHTLRNTLARYVKRKLLYRIWRGLYSIRDPKDLDPIFLGARAIGSFSYLSTETVLFEAGTINQRPTEITFVGNLSLRFSLCGHRYRVRKMRDDLLYNTEGIIEKDGYRMASSERAQKDMSYFNPKKQYDANK